MKVDHQMKLDRTEISTIRWMGKFTLKERKKNAELCLTSMHSCNVLLTSVASYI